MNIVQDMGDIHTRESGSKVRMHTHKQGEKEKFVIEMLKRTGLEENNNTGNVFPRPAFQNRHRY